MKKQLFITAFSLAAIAANACGCRPPEYGCRYTDKNYSDWGKLQLVGNQLSSKDGNIVQLKGWSTESLHSQNVQGCLGEGQWALMQNYGANTVRLSMFIDHENSYLSNPDTFKTIVKQSIAETAKLKMYCIVDWNIYELEGTSGDPNKFKNEAEEFFGEISAYCKENNFDHVLYDICGEPASVEWKNIKAYAEEIIPVILANQPDAIIIVGTDQWCQKINEPILSPINEAYKKNVMYAFHYYACSHYNLLGEFRNAQKEIPIFVSEWTPGRFDRKENFCIENSDDFLAACDEYQEAPQVVSWCISNWGKGDAIDAFFTDSCAAGNESKKTDALSRKYGNYVWGLMQCHHKDCDSLDIDPRPYTINKIPSTERHGWHWDYFNNGGEGVAYHDENSSAWKKDNTGAIVGYRNDGDEVDVLSLARKMQWINSNCPYSTVENNIVVEFDSTIATEWKDELKDNKPTYKSLNGGRNYSGYMGSLRPDDGVDLSAASCSGTPYEYKDYTHLVLVEDGEWINYTVDVEKAGLYKISGLVNAEYIGSFSHEEISIENEYGNLLRIPSASGDRTAVTSFGFPVTTTCADGKSISETYRWDCWQQSDAISGKRKEILCVFPKEGRQEIRIRFSGNAGGIGPLMFDFYKEIEEGFIIPCAPCDEEGDVDNVESAAKFTIAPNPTSGEFTITLAENVEAAVEVINMAGQIVASQKIKGNATIDKSLSAGIYTVIVKSEGEVSTQKLVVK